MVSQEKAKTSAPIKGLFQSLIGCSVMILHKFPFQDPPRRGQIYPLTYPVLCRKGPNFPSEITSRASRHLLPERSRENPEQELGRACVGCYTVVGMIQGSILPVNLSSLGRLQMVSTAALQSLVLKHLKAICHGVCRKL